jgi:hypothetical protein
MKSLIEYIKEVLIIEGGNAVNGTPMTQTQAKSVFDDVVEKLLPKLGLFKKGTDYEALGSFGKKYENQTSGDIDIAVSIETIASYFGIPVDTVEDKITSVCEEEKLRYTYNTGIHVISLAWLIPGTENYGQVDLMPSDNMEYSTWMYHAPDMTKAESKYKGLFRNQLIMAIIKYADQKVLSKNEKDEVMEYERYALRLNSGIARTVRSHVGKKGRLKNPKAVKELEKHVTNIPKEIVELAFGEGTNVKDTMTFESCYKLFMSDKFPWKDQRDDIVTSFVKEIFKAKYPIPSEMYKNFEDIIKPLQEEQERKLEKENID